MGGLPRSDARTLAVIVVTIGLLTAACTSSDDASPESSPEPVQAGQLSPEPPSIAGIVGTWERETHCEELVSALTEAGLDDWVLDAVAGNGFLPGVTDADEIANPAKPCKGAIPRVHAHFFTEEGLFGSLDWNGEQVDDGTYELVGEDTFVVSKEFPDVTFHYAIEGDSITLDPVIPDCSPDCFEAAWSVSVAYPGERWKLVDPEGEA